MNLSEREKGVADLLWHDNPWLPREQIYKRAKQIVANNPYYNYKIEVNTNADEKEKAVVNQAAGKDV